MSADEQFEHKLAMAWPGERWRDVGVLVAVSGGPDSVALLRALVRLGGESIWVGHFNHRLRPEGAGRDEQFVATLCKSLEIPCIVGSRADEPLPPGSLEAQAREARYRFLVETAERIGARYVATGHTADDQAETILHHIVRGTGLVGLAGMQPARQLTPAVSLVRPLLSIRRAEVYAYLAALGQPFQEDETNRDPALTRNRIRHELLPLLARDYSPHVAEALVRLGAVAGDAQRVLEQLAGELLERALVANRPGHVEIDCRRLAGQDRHLVRELFVLVWREQKWARQSMGLDEWNLLADMALADDAGAIAAQQLPQAIGVRRQDERLMLVGPAIEGRTFHA
jgi:tRNA(Ile)-lysidine synthase